MASATAISNATPLRPVAPRTLILIPCSQRKRRLPRAPVVALERYDGPLYRVLRKAIRAGCVAPTTDVAILSAKYGLLDKSTPIPFYDQRMTAARAVELAPQVRAALRRLIVAGRYNRIRVNLGSDYAVLLDGVLGASDAEWASGSIGVRAATLKAWLHEGVLVAPVPVARRTVTNGK